MRVYGKIWDKRLWKEVKLSTRQKGFVLIDGCFKNVSTLKNINANQLRRKEPTRLYSCIWAKAFDTVNHGSIRKGLRGKGVPMEVKRRGHGHV